MTCHWTLFYFSLQLLLNVCNCCIWLAKYVLYNIITQYKTERISCLCHTLAVAKTNTECMPCLWSPVNQLRIEWQSQGGWCALMSVFISHPTQYLIYWYEGQKNRLSWFFSVFLWDEYVWQGSAQLLCTVKLLPLPKQFLLMWKFDSRNITFIYSRVITWLGLLTLLQKNLRACPTFVYTNV